MAPTPRPGRSRRIAIAAAAALRAQGRTPPDATLAEHWARWAAPQGLSVSPAPLSRAVRRLGLPLNKRR